MTFFEDPAIVAVDPAVGYPMRTLMGRAVPAAGNPDVVRAVPAMIAVNPNEAPLRGWRTALDDGGRRADSNYNLRKGSCRSQTKGEQN